MAENPLEAFVRRIAADEVQSQLARLLGDAGGGVPQRRTRRGRPPKAEAGA